MKNEGHIRLHKVLNTMSISFQREVFVNIFYRVCKEFNKMYSPDLLYLSKMDLWKLMGFKAEDYTSNYLDKIVIELCQNTYFKVNENLSIGGSVFTAKLEEDMIKIAVTEFYKPYIFTKLDLDVMRKAKNNEKLRPRELEHWDKNLKEKSKQLVLLKEADILGLKGKYAKRLYTLLGQFKHTGFYITKIEKFREILEIPKSYRMSDIDKDVIKVATKEILKKTGIESLTLNKIKVGRKIERLEFTFSFKKEEKKPKPQKEIKQQPTSNHKKDLSEFEKAKEDLQALVMKNKDIPMLKRVDIGASLSDFSTIDEIEGYTRVLRERGIIE